MSGKLIVRQDGLLSLGDGNEIDWPALRMGHPYFATKWDALALAGRMFNLKQTTVGTAVAGSAQAAAGIVLTAPSIRFTVPTGKTVFPRRFNLTLYSAAGTENEIAVAYTSTDTYTSGGTAVTPLNWRTDSSAAATSVTNCYIAAGSAIVEAALVGVRALYQDVVPLAFAFATSYKLSHIVDVAWDDLHPIVGPASFLIWVSAIATASTMAFNLDWAEVPTVSVKAS